MAITKRSWFLPTIVVAVIALVGIAAALTHPLASLRDEGVVRDIVTAFGATERNVSFIKKTGDVRQDIRQQYEPFVTADLLSQWLASPQTAPGLKKAGEIPDHIVIDSVSHQGSGYVVVGSVDVINDNPALAEVHIPVVIFMLLENGAWRIAAYQEQAVAVTQ